MNPDAEHVGANGQTNIIIQFAHLDAEAAAAVSEQFSRGTINLYYERTQNEAADIGTKRFTDPWSTS